MSKSMLLRGVAIVILAMLASSIQAAAPQANNSAAASSKVEATSEISPAVRDKLSDLDVRLRMIDYQQGNITIYGGILAALVALLGVIPMIAQHLGQRNDRKTQDQFLKSSADTIRLVNDTLLLAKEASERAANSAERRAIKELEDLDSLASDIIIRSSQKDDRDIVANPANRSELEALAERIQSFDIYTVILDEKVGLTPNCYFIRGIHAHLKQHFDEAIKLWRKCAIDSRTMNQLRSLAYYWIGYECNNLGKFAEAVHSFNEAEKYADDNRKYELRRISLEASFFDTSISSVDAILVSIENLLNDVESRANEYGMTPYIDSVMSTTANMLYVRGTDTMRASGTLTAEAKTDLERSEVFFRKVSNQNKWSRLGACQCAISLNHGVDQARSVLQNSVLPAARDEFVKRVEPRSKVLARLTELICALANECDDATLESLRGQVLSSLGDVDNRLTLYSLKQRRNVSKDAFVKDLEVIIEARTGG